MRIAIFTEAYLPHIGGMITNISILAESLITMGHEVLVVSAEPKARDFHVDGMVLKCPAKPAKNQFGFAIANPASNDFFNRLEKFKPDVVHVHTDSPIGQAAIKFASRFDLPMVFTIHDYFENHLHYAATSRFTEPAVRIAGKSRFKDLVDNADVITSASKKATSYLKECKIKRELMVVPNNTDCAYFDYNKVSPSKVQQLKRSLNIPMEKTVALFAGPLVMEKSVEVLLEEWSQEIKAEDNLHLLIIGDGPEAEPLSAWAQDLGISGQVSFLGAAPHEKLLEYYAVSDVYVSASVNDMMSQSVLEANACGVPAVLKHDPENSARIQDGVGGFYYKSPKELAKYLKLLGSLDDDGKRILRKVVRRSVKDIPKNAQAAKMMEVYDKAVHLHFYHPAGVR